MQDFVVGSSLTVRLENHLRHRCVLGVSDGKMSTNGSQPVKEFRSSAMENHRRPSSRSRADFHVLPGHAQAPACPDGLHSSFLGGKTASIALSFVGFRLAVADLVGREYPLEEPPPKALDGSSYPWHFRDVNPSSDDHMQFENLS